MKRKAKAKPKKLCPHDAPGNWRGRIMFRCRCGNVWMGGKFFGSVPKDRSAVAVLGLFRFSPAPSQGGPPDEA